MSDLKIVVFGCGAVGKSALTFQFVHGEFIADYNPTIEDTYMRPFSVDGEPYRLNITDTAGQDDFAAMRVSYIRQAQGFILVYAIDDQASFEELPSFYTLIRQTKGTTNFPCVVCGNKCDLEDRRYISKEEGEDFAKKIGAKFFETSAVVNYGIHDAFLTLSRDIIESIKPKPQQEPVPSELVDYSCCQIA